MRELAVFFKTFCLLWLVTTGIALAIGVKPILGSKEEGPRVFWICAAAYAGCCFYLGLQKGKRRGRL